MPAAVVATVASVFERMPILTFGAGDCVLWATVNQTAELIVGLDWQHSSGTGWVRAEDAVTQVGLIEETITATNQTVRALPSTGKRIEARWKP